MYKEPDEIDCQVAKLVDITMQLLEIEGNISSFDTSIAERLEKVTDSLAVIVDDIEVLKE